MSTKIYDAFLYSGTLTQLHEKFQQIREEIESECVLIIESYMRESIYGCFGYNDRLTESYLKSILAEGEITKDTLLHQLHSWDIVTLLKDLQNSHRNEELNFKKSAVIIPYKKKLIVQFFLIGRKWIEQIENDSMFKDFHYQNQSDAYFESRDYKDQNGEVVAKERKKYLKREWNQRRKIWDEIYKYYDTPIEVGFQCNFVTDRNLYNIVDKFREKVKSIDLSIPSNKMAVSKVYDKIMALTKTDKNLLECWLGEMFDAHFNDELYLLYDKTKAIPDDNSMEQIKSCAIDNGIVFNVVEMKDREKFRSPYERNAGATQIETLVWMCEKYMRKEDEQFE